MLAVGEAGEVFALLEGGAAGARAASTALISLYTSVRDPWLTRALFAYHARTGSVRALDLLARAPDHHARHLLDALHDNMRADPTARAQALACLAPLLARRPAWLHCLATHPLPRDLLRAARHERHPLPALHALLALAALLPAAPALAAPLWPDLTEALLRPAAAAAASPGAQPHLQLAQLALFHALYATHPCTLLESLRAEYASSSRESWARSVLPLVDSVRLHPALVTGSAQREADAARWARLDLHDVLASCRRLSLSAPPAPAPPEERASTPRPTRGPAAASPAPGSTGFASRAAALLRPGTEPWFPLSERSGADSAPQTPLPAEAEAPEPPEAAVEATPENTPAKDTRAQFRFPVESSAVRAIGRGSQPPSPLRKETSPSAGAGPGTVAGGSGSGSEGYGGRLARVALDRAALEADGASRRRAPDSPVPFGGTPPPAGAPVARPEPNRPPLVLDAEDREVLELTARAQTEDAWSESEGLAMPRALDPRRRAPTLPLRCGSAARPLRRAASCPPRAAAAARTDVAVQTIDTWPKPYEFIIADFYRALPDECYQQRSGGECEGGEAAPATDRLDAYLRDLCAGRPTNKQDLAEQVSLLHAQLQYERWRREVHAERNRRLLGRCRAVRALELQNGALRDRVRALTRERDQLRASRPPRDPPPPPPPHLAELHRALDDERANRIKAEAALHELELVRQSECGELAAARALASEAARAAEGAARAARAAERRGGAVRRLRAELLVLAEREARLTAALRDAAVNDQQLHHEHHKASVESGLRAALARERAARGEAEAAAARTHDLEATLAARDAALAELKRQARHAADEHAARTQALQDKYAALLKVVRTEEGRRLVQLAGPSPSAPTPAAGPCPRPNAALPPAPPIPLSDSARLRSLIDLDDDPPLST